MAKKDYRPLSYRHHLRMTMMKHHKCINGWWRRSQETRGPIALKLERSLKCFVGNFFYFIPVIIPFIISGCHQDVSFPNPPDKISSWVVRVNLKINASILFIIITGTINSNKIVLLVNLRENDNLFDNFGKAICTECLPFLFYPLYQQLPFGNSVVFPSFCSKGFHGRKAALEF